MDNLEYEEFKARLRADADEYPIKEERWKRELLFSVSTLQLLALSRSRSLFWIPYNKATTRLDFIHGGSEVAREFRIE